MRRFECERCPDCCTRLLNMTDGKEHGIYLAPEEIVHFPKESVFPLFRSGGKVFAYQLATHDCPNLVTKENGHMGCKIYQNRPLICRSFPLGFSGDKGLVVIQFDKCRATINRENEQWDMTSFADCFKAAKEQIEQAKSTPQATEMFVLNGKKWVKL